MSTYNELVVELKDVLGRIYNQHDDHSAWVAESKTPPIMKGGGKNPTEALMDLKNKLNGVTATPTENR